MPGRVILPAFFILMSANVISAVRKATAPNRLPRDFKFAYLVNVAVEKGFEYGTFTPLQKSGKQGSFIKPHGMGLADVVEYYTDERVTDDPANRAMHYKKVVLILEGKLSFRQASAIAIPSSQDDDAVEEAVRQIMGAGGTTEDMEHAVDRINNAVASSRSNGSILAASRSGVF